MSKCIIDNCIKKQKGLKLCSTHYRLYCRDNGIVLISETAEYKVWCDIKRRCNNKNTKSYYLYGGRGISISNQWEDSFSTFLADVGYRPTPKHSIDRINNNGNYELGNVRWATKHQQTANRRSNNEDIGVHLDRYSQRWFATLTVNKKIVYRKSFIYKDDAIAARKAAEKEYGIVL